MFSEFIDNFLKKNKPKQYNKKIELVSSVWGDEIARDQKLSELAWLLICKDLDYAIIFLYNWNIKNIDNTILVDDIHKRVDWLNWSHLNQYYTNEELEIDNKLLEPHDLHVELPTPEILLKYKMRKKDEDDE